MNTSPDTFAAELADWRRTRHFKSLNTLRGKLAIAKFVSLGRVMVPLGFAAAAAAAGDDLVGSVRHYFNKIKLDVTAMIDNGFSRLFPLSLFASPRLEA